MKYPEAERARVNIATNLSNIMRRRNLSRSELARISDVPIMTISRMVAGRNVPSIGLIVRVANSLGVPVVSLIQAKRRRGT